MRAAVTTASLAVSRTLSVRARRRPRALSTMSRPRDPGGPRDPGAVPSRAPPARPAHHRFVDIGANLTDGMFRGVYHGKAYHDADLEVVLRRAWDAGVEKIIITAGTLEEAREALALAERLDPQTEAFASGAVAECPPSDASPAAPFPFSSSSSSSSSSDRRRLFTTVGVHPTRCDAFAESGDPEAYFAALLKLIETNAYPEGRVVAVGECGLDWDRTQFCAKETQLLWFERQFELAERTNLPMFLHSRACAAEFAETLDKCLPRLTTRTASASESADDATIEDIHRNTLVGRHHHPGVVVHSFTGGEDELRDLASRPGVFVGVNGCSLRGEATLAALASGACALERLMLETDAPWCGVKASHPGFGAIKTTWPAKDKKKRAGIDSGETVKDRSEPCHVAQVMEILAETMRASEKDVAEACRANALRVFFGDEKGERERPSSRS